MISKRPIPTLFPTVTALVLSLTVLTSCAADTNERAPAPSGSASAIDRNALNPGAAVSGHAVEANTDGEVPPQWDGEAKTTAVATAVEAMKLYARPSVGGQEWLGDLRPLATLEFLDDHAGINTEFIAVKAPEDTGELSFDLDNGYGCTVLVGSDAGTYTVELLRLDGERPWKVNAVIPLLGQEAQQ